MKGRRFGIAAISATIAFGAVFTIGHAAGLRLNLTDSAPHGLWLVRAADMASIKRGALVEVCPPASPVVSVMVQRGYLSPGDCAGLAVTALLKPVSAVSGDTIRLEHGQPATVNGVALPNTVAMPAIPAWPDGTYTVKHGQAWLFSSYSAGSFDSRYFGPVELATVRGIATPVAVHGDPAVITTGVKHQ